MNIKDKLVCVEGEGKAMILLHGWGLNHHYMDDIFMHFKNNYKVCSLDLPGFGDTVLTRPYTLDDYVQYIYEISILYHLDQPIFIAHSFGARIAFRYASKYPCSYIIATGAAGMKPKRGMQYYFRVLMYKIMKHFPFKVTSGSEDYKKADPILRKTLVHVVNDHNEKDFCAIECPILLVWGKEDSETPLYMAKRMQKLNKNTVLIVFEKEDHFAYYHQMKRFIKICEHALKEGA